MSRPASAAMSATALAGSGSSGSAVLAGSVDVVIVQTLLPSPTGADVRSVRDSAKGRRALLDELSRGRGEPRCRGTGGQHAAGGMGQDVVCCGREDACQVGGRRTLGTETGRQDWAAEAGVVLRSVVNG